MLTVDVGMYTGVRIVNSLFLITKLKYDIILTKNKTEE
jgi:hypothetical protein